MNSKDKAFWRLHMKEAAMRNLDVDERSVENLIDKVSIIGNMSLDTALNKVGQKQNAQYGKNLVEILSVDEDVEDPDQVDEGEIAYHDYQGALLENHPFESVYVTDYSMLSVPEAIA